jgi:hypothetical protein
VTVLLWFAGRRFPMPANSLLSDADAALYRPAAGKGVAVGV